MSAIERELTIRRATSVDIPLTAQMESLVLIHEVFSRHLPTCELGLPRDEVDGRMRVSQIGLQNYVTTHRQSLLTEKLQNPDNTVLVAQNSQGEIIGKGVVRFRPESKRASLNSFVVDPAHEGPVVGLMLLRQVFKEIEEYNLHHEEKIETISLGRYARSERNNGLFTRIARLVNNFQPDTVRIERDLWEGNEVYYYYFPKDVAADILEELGEKLATNL